MVSIDSDSVHKDLLDDIVAFIWNDGGRMIERTLIDLTSSKPVLKQLPADTQPLLDGPNIKGVPIADDEVDRGTGLTSTAVKSEMQIWASIPELAEYVPDEYRIT